MNSRRRTNMAVNRQKPDRLPVDFLATTEIWEKLISHFGLSPAKLGDSDFVDPTWEKILTLLDVDCRVLSYDQFCSPPLSALPRAGKVEWWDVRSRSTPSRMWRHEAGNGLAYDIFGRCFRRQRGGNADYEENVPVLAEAESLDDVKKHPWPDPSWWDFSRLPEVIAATNRGGEKHIRFRMGSVFEIAWQLRGMDRFFMDLALEPEIPAYLMENIANITVAVAEQAMQKSGGLIDMVYFYDDIASNASLMLSRDMWEEFIKPQHEKLIAVAKKHGVKVMYHSDGALRQVMDDLIAMGVDVLNPIQPNTQGMEPAGLKADYGDRLSFHGGIDIVNLLPKGNAEDVRGAVKNMGSLLGGNGGYIMTSSHHIQPDTPLENVLAMYELALR